MAPGRRFGPHTATRWRERQDPWWPERRPRRGILATSATATASLGKEALHHAPSYSSTPGTLSHCIERLFGRAEPFVKSSAAPLLLVWERRRHSRVFDELNWNHLTAKFVRIEHYLMNLMKQEQLTYSSNAIGSKAKLYFINP